MTLVIETAMPWALKLFSAQGIYSHLGVPDGARTRYLQSHNLALCRMSYGHHATHAV